MSLAVVQSHNAIHGIQVPGAVTITSAPTAGNLLIAFLGVNASDGGITIGTGWTRFDQVIQYQSTNVNMICVYRYVVGGDTSTLPAFATSGTTYWTHQIWEISGVNGTWENDILGCYSIQGDLMANSALPALPVFANGSLALTGTASYNGNSDPSITGSWTLDNANHNSSNYGSASGAHRAVNAGDTLDGTWTQGNQAPLCLYLLILTPSQPTKAWPGRVYFRDCQGQEVPTHACLYKPKNGALYLATVNWRDGSTTNPTFASSWNNFATQVRSGANNAIMALYYYGKTADTVLPVLSSAGSADYHTVSIVEVLGLTGTWSSDFVGYVGGYKASGETYCASQMTTGPDQLAVTDYGQYNANTPGAMTNREVNVQWYNSFRYGDTMLGHRLYPTSGSTAVSTMTSAYSSYPAAFMQFLFTGGVSSGGGGGSAGALNRAFPAAIYFRVSPIDMSRSFPRA